MRIGFLFAIISAFAPIHAFAESGLVSLQAATSLTRADEEANRICSQIQKDPSCGTALSLMKSSLGLSVASCKAQLASKNCQRFVEEFPEYQNKLMSCEPYEVCKLSLGSTMGEGCRRYGIEVKSQFLHTLERVGACASSVNCTGKHLYQALKESILTMIVPGALMQKVMDAEAHVLEDLHNDYKKMDGISCLDPETQFQFSCYLMVKYGGAVLGAGAAAKKGAEIMVNDMAKLETRVTASETRLAKMSAKPELDRGWNFREPPTVIAKTSNQIAIEEKIKNLEPLLIKEVKRLQLALNGPHCSGVSCVLSDLIPKETGLKPEIVFLGLANKNRLSVAGHTFIEIKDFYGPGVPMLIDPTFTQFNPSAAFSMTNHIFVGTPSEMIEAFHKIGYDAGEFVESPANVVIDSNTIANKDTWQNNWLNVIQILRRSPEQLENLTPLNRNLNSPVSP